MLFEIWKKAKYVFSSTDWRRRLVWRKKPGALVRHQVKMLPDVTDTRGTAVRQWYGFLRICTIGWLTRR